MRKEWIYSSLLVLIFLALSSHAATGKVMAFEHRVSSGPPFRIELNNKFGFIDVQGNVVVKPMYDDAGDFFEGLARVRVKDKWGYIDSSGAVVVKPQFALAGDFSEALAFASKKDKSGFITKDGHFAFFIPAGGRLASGPEERMRRFSSGLIPINIANKWGFLDNFGKIAIKPVFDDVAPFSDGLARVEISDPTDGIFGRNGGYIDKRGNFLIPPIKSFSGDFSEGRAGVVVLGFSGSFRYFIDHTGKIGPQLDSSVRHASRFSEGLASIEHRGGWWGLIDKTGKYVFYLDDVNEVGDFSDGMLRIKVGDGFGYINKEGKLLIQPQFDTATDFFGGLAKVTIGEMSAYIDKSGKFVWQSENSPLRCSRISPEATTTPIPLPPDLMRQSAQQMVQQLVPVVEQIRGLTLRYPVAVVSVSTEQYRQAVMNRYVLRGGDASRWKRRELFLKQLGVLPPNTDLLAALQEYSTRAHPVFYDPEANRILIPQPPPTSFSLQLGLVYALAQAVDFQNFGSFRAAMTNGVIDEQQLFALRAVSQGSASLIASSYLTRLQIDVPDSPTATEITAPTLETGKQRAPFYIFETIMRPSLAGQWFLSRARINAVLTPCSADITHALNSPPLSSGQVLHPDKYWNRKLVDLPRRITLPSTGNPLGNDWVLQERSTLGEQFVTMLVGARTTPRVNQFDNEINEEAFNADEGYYTLSNPISVGLRGDELARYGNNSQSVSVWATVWDRNFLFSDADKFDKFIDQMVTERTAQGDPPPMIKLRSGSTVIIVVGGLPKEGNLSLTSFGKWILESIKIG